MSANCEFASTDAVTLDKFAAAANQYIAMATDALNTGAFDASNDMVNNLLDAYKTKKARIHAQLEALTAQLATLTAKFNRVANEVEKLEKEYIDAYGEHCEVSLLFPNDME